MRFLDLLPDGVELDREPRKIQPRPSNVLVELRSPPAMRAIEGASPSFLDEVIRRLVTRGTEEIILLNTSPRIQETIKTLKRVAPDRDDALELQVS